MKLIGIKRSQRFSPNKTASDDAILEAVASELRCQGHHVLTLTEQEFQTAVWKDTMPLDADGIFGMYREEQTLAMLENLPPAQGCFVVTSTQGVRNAGRQQQFLLLQGQVPLPPTIVLHDESEVEPLPFPCWLKKGRGWSETKDDVVFVRTAAQAREVVFRFREQSKEEPLSVVASAHLVGDLVKFYGVEGTGFFTWNYADMAQSKFGWEQVNGAANGHPFSSTALQAAAEHAARLLQIPVYGGDAVVAADGSFAIIDFNDWPSFGSCRDEAAKAIAQRISNESINNTAK